MQDKTEAGAARLLRPLTDEHWFAVQAALRARAPKGTLVNSHQDQGYNDYCFYLTRRGWSEQVSLSFERFDPGGLWDGVYHVYGPGVRLDTSDLEAAVAATVAVVPTTPI